MGGPHNVEVELVRLSTQLAAHMSLSAALRDGDREAVNKAFAAASELAKAHNDLLRNMDRLRDSFATKDAMVAALRSVERDADRRIGRLESWQARMTGALALVAVIGVGNFVKVWSG